MPREIAPTPWRKDRWGSLMDANGQKILVNGVALPAGVHPDAAQADVHRDLLLAAPDLLHACEQALPEIRSLFHQLAGHSIDRPGPGEYGVRHAVDLLVDAIAKAKGDAHA